MKRGRSPKNMLTLLQRWEAGRFRQLVFSPLYSRLLLRCLRDACDSDMAQESAPTRLFFLQTVIIVFQDYISLIPDVLALVQDWLSVAGSNELSAGVIGFKCHNGLTTDSV